MILPPRSRVHGRHLGHRQRGRAPQDEHQHDAVQQRHRPAGGDRDGERGGDGRPRVADVPSLRDDVEQRELLAGAGLEAQAGERVVLDAAVGVGEVCCGGGKNRGLRVSEDAKSGEEGGAKPTGNGFLLRTLFQTRHAFPGGFGLGVHFPRGRGR